MSGKSIPMEDEMPGVPNNLFSYIRGCLFSAVGDVTYIISGRS